VLAVKGDESRNIQACANCHGPEGAGLGDNPYIAGLDAKYLDAALREWKDGKRKTDPSEQMAQIARVLDDADIKALAAYYSSLPPPQVASAASKEPGARPAAECRKSPVASIVCGPQRGGENRHENCGSSWAL
jgi:cytochrome c553